MMERSESGWTKASWLSGTWRRSLFATGRSTFQLRFEDREGDFGAHLTSIAFAGRLAVIAPPNSWRCAKSVIVDGIELRTMFPKMFHSRSKWGIGAVVVALFLSLTTCAGGRRDPHAPLSTRRETRPGHRQAGQVDCLKNSKLTS
jgi:hypothetical protein